MNRKILQQLSHKIFVDQIGNTVLLNNVPHRIICLVPSITELLFHFGLGDRVVGITKFCVHPNEWFIAKIRVGGTKNINIKKVLALQPELIIANKEENVKEQINTLALSVPVYVSDVYNVETALQMIAEIGNITHTQKKADAIIKSIKKNFSTLNKFEKKKKVLYLIWRNPYITIGSDTFIHCLLDLMGLQNIFTSKKRYPTIDLIALKNKKIDFIFLSSEPYPFKERHIVEINIHFPKAKIILVNGEMFSWYGSRLQYAPTYFNKLLQKIIT